MIGMMKSLAFLAALAWVLPLSAEEEMPATVPARMMPGANYAMTVEPPILMRSQHFDYDHEIRVALPATYGVEPEREYPVLWVTDGSFAFHLVVGIVSLLSATDPALDIIVVSVGAPNDTGMPGMGRRDVELAPPGDRYLFDGPGADWIYEQTRAQGVDLDALPQKADEFLSFFIDEVRPTLAKKYRFNDDHGLFGHSGGGLFTAYALFARPLEFDKYIIGSPSITASDRKVFTMEEAYAQEHDDFPVSVYLAAGGAEINEMTMAAWEIVSTPILLAERLRLRQYPSLKLTGRVYDGRDHITVIPLIVTDGIQALWGSTAAQ